MRRLQPFSFTPSAPRAGSPAKPATMSHPQPRDEMWRSRRVLSGSDWMDAWVQAPKRR